MKKWFGMVVSYVSYIWAGDTGVYFAGRSFGQRKLFERKVLPTKHLKGLLVWCFAVNSVAITYAYYILPEVSFVPCKYFGIGSGFRALVATYLSRY